MSEQDRAKGLITIVDKLKAGLWDRHYGNGLSPEYARCVDAEFDKLIKELPALAAENAALREALKNIIDADTVKMGPRCLCAQCAAIDKARAALEKKP